MKVRKKRVQKERGNTKYKEENSNKNKKWKKGEIRKRKEIH
jgi:hypothetical protein